MNSGQWRGIVGFFSGQRGWLWLREGGRAMIFLNKGEKKGKKVEKNVKKGGNP